jgi:hypothetical protein
MNLDRRGFLAASLAGGLLYSLEGCGGGGSAPAPKPTIELKLLAGGNPEPATLFAPSAPEPLDGTGAAAQFYFAQAPIVDPSGNIYLIDGNAIRKVSATGVVTTLAGDVLDSGYVDAVGTAARFFIPLALAFDPNGNILVSEATNLVRCISPTGVVSTLIGSTTASLGGQTQTVAGTLATLSPGYQSPLVVDRNGNILIAPYGSVIKIITPAGAISTLAGNTSTANNDGVGTAASFGLGIAAMSMDSTGDIFLTQYQAPALNVFGNPYTPGGAIVRKIGTGAVVTTVAGGTNGAPNAWGYVNGPAASAEFTQLSGIAIDSAGDLYLADELNLTVRKITISSGNVSSVVGNGYVANPKTVLGPLPAELGVLTGVAVSGSRLIVTTETGILYTTALP